MKSFWKTFFASLLAVVAGGLIVFFIGVSVIAGMIGALTKEKEVSVHDGSLLTIDLKGSVEERTVDDPFSEIFGGGSSSLAVNDVLKALHTAKTDDRIAGVLLRCDMLTVGLGHADALRHAISDFKSSKKFVYAYAENYAERAWYIATEADSILMAPTGMIEWNGLVSTQFFLKGMFEKLGIQPRVFRVGEFKSAGEMFDRTSLSDENRKQLKEYVNGMWQHIVDNAAQSRGLSAQDLHSYASTLQVTQANEAKQHGMIDAILYTEELRDLLKEKVSVSKKGKIHQVSLSNYLKALPKKKAHPDARIAIVYANGNIMTGTGDENTVGSTDLVRTLRKLRENTRVKAVVLRVNSPGGSALASELIAHEVKLLKKEKPVIVSMGNVAASGGYYISAPADRIFAEPTTITGSIGVIGVIANMETLFNKHLGITFDRVHADGTPHADILSPTRKMAPLEVKRLQDMLDSIYHNFVHVVQSGRGFASFEEVDALARGRVYSGKEALALKLVDELGGLPQAVAHAAERAGLGEDAYSIMEKPHLTSPLERILKSLDGEDKNKTLAHLQQMVAQAVGTTHAAFLRSLVQQHSRQPLGFYTHMGTFLHVD